MRLKQVRCVDIRPDPRSSGYRPHYVIVHGERRWKAAQMAGLDAIPAWMVQEFEHGAAVAA